MSPYVFPGLVSRTQEEKLSAIYAAIEYVSGYPVQVLRHKGRGREKVLARAFSYYFIKAQTKKTLKEIGKLYGTRDHTTVIHGLKLIPILIQQQDELTLEWKHKLETLGFKVNHTLLTKLVGADKKKKHANIQQSSTKTI